MSSGNIFNPCVNKSEYETIIHHKNVYLGLMYLQSLESKIGMLIPQEQKNKGDYQSLEDFVHCILIGIKGPQIHIYIGAFRFTGESKSELLVQARLLLINFKLEDLMVRIQEPAKEYKLPKLEHWLFEEAFDEIELLRFPVFCSPFDLLQTK